MSSQKPLNSFSKPIQAQSNLSSNLLGPSLFITFSTLLFGLIATEWVYLTIHIENSIIGILPFFVVLSGIIYLLYRCFLKDPISPPTTIKTKPIPQPASIKEMLCARKPPSKPITHKAHPTVNKSPASSIAIAKKSSLLSSSLVWGPRSSIWLSSAYRLEYRLAGALRRGARRRAPSMYSSSSRQLGVFQE